MRPIASPEGVEIVQYDAPDIGKKPTVALPSRA